MGNGGVSSCGNLPSGLASAPASDAPQAPLFVQTFLLSLGPEEPPVPKLPEYPRSLHRGLEPLQQSFRLFTLSKTYECQIIFSYGPDVGRGLSRSEGDYSTRTQRRMYVKVYSDAEELRHRLHEWPRDVVVRVESRNRPVLQQKPDALLQRLDLGPSQVL